MGEGSRKVTVAEAEQRRRECLSESRKRAVQTLKRRREERGKEGGSGEEDSDDSDVGDE